MFLLQGGCWYVEKIPGHVRNWGSGGEGGGRDECSRGVCGYSAVQLQCSAEQVALCNCRERGGGDKWMRCREVEEERAVNGRFWCLARMNKSGFDASADHISTGFGQLQSVICSIKQITLKHVC